VKGGFWDKFRGSFDVGAGYTSATELLQLDFDAKLRYTRPRFGPSPRRTPWSLSSRRRTTPGAAR
jgi:hypothetical protein